jgi:hypothetical protein
MASITLWLYNRRFLKPQVWVVAEVVTFSFNPIVSTCVLNQSRGHWLLLDTLTMNMETKLLQLFKSFEVSNPFEVEILLLHKHM